MNYKKNKMSKRFTDTEIWDKEWFMSLEPRLKCLVKYVRDKCDLAGIWHPNFLLANMMIGERINEDELLDIDAGQQFRKLKDGKIFCCGFVEFQYGNSLNPASPVHKKVLSILEKHNINLSELITNNTDSGESAIERKRFSPPSKQEVYEEMILKVDPKIALQEADKFIHYYESNGWMVGKNKMKSWKAAVAGWIGRLKPPTTSSQSSVYDIQKKLQQIGNRKYSEL